MAWYLAPSTRRARIAARLAFARRPTQNHDVIPRMALCALVAFGAPAALVATFPAHVCAQETPTPAATPAGTVLVLDLRPYGVPAHEAALVTQQLAAEIARLPDRTVLTYADLAHAAETAALQRDLACAEQAACLARLGDAVRADRAVAGSLGRVGADYVLGVHVVDPRTARPDGSAAVTFGTLDAVPSVLPDLVATAFGGRAARAAQGGTFRLRTSGSTSIAVFDLEPSGVAEDVARNLTQILATQIKQVQGAHVISRDDIRSLLSLEATRMQLDCASDVSCLAEIGGALGVEKLVTGTAGKLADSYVVALRLVDVKAVRVDNRVVETFQGQEGQLIPALRRAGRALLGQHDPARGGLAVSANIGGAQVHLDGALQGLLPMPAIGDLEPGRYELRLTHESHEEWRSDVFVEPGQTTSVWADLQEVPLRWYQRWWVWATAGAVLAGSVTTAVVLSQSGGGGRRDVTAVAPPLP